MRRKKRRAAAMIEFVIVFPIAMAFLMLSFDIGRVYMTANSLQLATSRAARAGAVYGAAGREPSNQSRPCVSHNGAIRDDYVVLDTFCSTLYGLPGGVSIVNGTTKLRISGGVGDSQVCSKNSNIIKVEATVSVVSMVPGANELLPGGRALPGSWPVSLQSAATCEVVAE